MFYQTVLHCGHQICVLMLLLTYQFDTNKIILIILMCIFRQALESDISHKREIEREIFYLTMHSTHFIYSYMASDILFRTILIVRKETCCHHVGYSIQLTARNLLYTSSHRQDKRYYSLCYTSRGALAGTRNR